MVQRSADWRVRYFLLEGDSWSTWLAHILGADSRIVFFITRAIWHVCLDGNHEAGNRWRKLGLIRSVGVLWMIAGSLIYHLVHDSFFWDDVLTILLCIWGDNLEAISFASLAPLLIGLFEWPYMWFKKRVIASLCELAFLFISARFGGYCPLSILFHWFGQTS